MLKYRSKSLCALTLYLFIMVRKGALWLSWAAAFLGGIPSSLQAQRRTIYPMAIHVGGTLAPVQGQGSTSPELVYCFFNWSNYFIELIMSKLSYA